MRSNDVRAFARRRRSFRSRRNSPEQFRPVVNRAGLSDPRALPASELGTPRARQLGFALAECRPRDFATGPLASHRDSAFAPVQFRGWFERYVPDETFLPSGSW